MRPPNPAVRFPLAGRPEECHDRIVIEDFERCYRAVQGKDARFDGWFFTAVTSTGIYCRPSCPAITPKRANVRFYPTAAAAQLAGFRACKRCRPDATPGSPEWNMRADVVGRAMRLIADGVVDRDGVRGLAARLGYSERHLHRQLTAEVGAGPIALARAQRAQTARILIETTELPFAQVAFGAGFASIRQFNDTVREVFASTPTELRAKARPSGHARSTPAADLAGLGRIALRLAVRQPFDGDGLLAFLGPRAVPGIEELTGATYRRTLDLPHGPAVIDLTPAPDHVRCAVRLHDLRDLAERGAAGPEAARPRRRSHCRQRRAGRRRAPRSPRGQVTGAAVAWSCRRCRAGHARSVGTAGVRHGGPHAHRPARHGRRYPAGSPRRGAHASVPGPGRRG